MVSQRELVGRLGVIKATPHLDVFLPEEFRPPASLHDPAGASVGTDVPPVLVRPRRGATYQQPGDFPRRAETVLRLLDAHLSREDVVINLFSTAPDAALEDLQEGFLDAVFGAVAALVSSGVDPVARLDDVIRVAASATDTGLVMRGLFGDPMRQPAPVDPPKGGASGQPGILARLLKTFEAFRRQACAGAFLRGLKDWGDAMRDSTPFYVTTAVITAMQPADACAGDHLTLTGSGFDPSARRTVAFTGEHDSVVLVDAADVVSWSDSSIEVIVPAAARRGPVGVVTLPSTTPLRAAAGAFIAGEVAECFGPAVLARMQEHLDSLWPALSAPTAQADNANVFTGGPPIIESFYVTPAGPLWPGRRIELRWRITGAGAVTIAPRAVGTEGNELPIVPGPLLSEGSVQVTVPGTRAWRGQYVLAASNACTTSGPVEAVVGVEMVLRRGLALGGGGSRGDFQVGALLYLYDTAGLRPDAIASTSVGSINAVDLAMGDYPPAEGQPGRSAASRLAEHWTTLFHDDGDMWSDEPWLTKVKADLRQFVRSLSVEGLIVLPYTLVADISAVSDAMSALKDVVALFNLDPLEEKLRTHIHPARVASSGIRLRMVAVSLETGELVMVDETGSVLEGWRPVRHRGVGPAPATGVIEGALASATMPGIFPAQRLADHMCVDGGVREVIPVETAVADLGCNEVYAIRVSAPASILETDPHRQIGAVIARSVLELTYDEVARSDLAPYNGWGEGVRVITIAPTLNLHDPMVIEPGLIRIGIDYGWMRAAERVELSAEDQATAVRTSDEIIALRAQNWRLAHSAAGATFWDPNRGFTDALLRGALPQERVEVVPIPDPEAVDIIRRNCLRIRDLIAHRIIAGAPLPPIRQRSSWFLQWETIHQPPLGSSPWDSFDSRLGHRDAATPPDSL